MLKRIAAVLRGEKKEFIFYTSLDTDECLKRLKISFETKRVPWPVMRASATRFFGSINNRKFHIERETGHRAGRFFTFNGELERVNAATKISGYFDTSLAFKFSTLLLALILIDWLVFFLPLLLARGDWAATVFISFGLTAFSAVVLTLIKLAMRNDRRYILALLYSALEATPAINQTNSPG